MNIRTVEAGSSELLTRGHKEVLALSAQGAPLQDILNALVRSAQHVKTGTRAAIFILDRAQEKLRFAAAAGMPEGYTRTIDGFEVGPAQPSCGKAAFTGEAEIDGDISTNPSWAPYADLAKEYGIQACWSFPLYTANRKVLGTFTLYHGIPCRPVETEYEEIQYLAHIASMAIERYEASILGGAEAILNSITDAFYSLNRDWEFTYLNRQAYRVLDREPGTLSGKNIWQEYPGLVGNEIEKMYRRVIGSQASESITAYYPDHQRWYEVHCYPTLDGIAIYFRDVTERIHSEERLWDSEIRFRMMADSIPQIVWITDAAGNVEFFNRQWYEYTGCAIKLENAGQVSTDFVHPDDQVPTMTAWEEAAKIGKTFIAEHRIRSASGEYRWFLVRAQPQRDPATRKITRWYGTSTDIHENRTAEAALRQSEERFRSLTLATSQIVWIGEPNGEIVRDSLSWRLFTGQTYDEWKGYGWINAVHPEDQERTLPLWKECVEERKTYHTEYRLRRAGGEYRWTVCRAIPVLNQDGSIREWIGINTDVTETKQATFALQRSEERLKLATEGAKIGIWDWDMQTGKVEWSREAYEVHGRALEPPVTSVDEFNRLVHPDDLPMLWQKFNQALNEGTIYEAECRILTEAGEERWIMNWASIYRNERGEPVRAVGTVIDITERKRYELALKDADRRKDEFLAMLAHELRNPLAPISAAAELMEMINLNEKSIKETSRIINRQVRHMTDLVDDLLDVSRVTRGLVRIEHSVQDIKAVIAGSIEQVRPLIESRGHHLTVELAPESAHVSGDHKRLVQVLSNLLNNAAKYTPERGIIQISMETLDGHVAVSVKDNGIGIAPTLQPHIFELFSQAERTSDRAQGGLGIGLALVKSLVELHGGKISCRSDGYGKGSEFTVTLPRLVDQNPGQPAEKSQAAASSRKRLRILIVDDNADAAKMLAMYLEALGYEVMVENSSRQALVRAEKESPDICLLDIGLPEMDGNEVARRMKAHAGQKRPLLIAVTGYGQEQDIEQAMAAGFDHHFVKPVDIGKLAALLQKL